MRCVDSTCPNVHPLVRRHPISRSDHRMAASDHRMSASGNRKRLLRGYLAMARIELLLRDRLGLDACLQAPRPPTSLPDLVQRERCGVCYLG
eukprot:671264-Rhodomonas_salina.4